VFRFCPNCGATVHWQIEGREDSITRGSRSLCRAGLSRADGIRLRRAQARLGYLAAACEHCIAKRPTANRAFDQIRRGPPAMASESGCCNFVLLVRPSDSRLNDAKSTMENANEVRDQLGSNGRKGSPMEYETASENEFSKSSVNGRRRPISRSNSFVVRVGEWVGTCW